MRTQPAGSQEDAPEATLEPRVLTFGELPLGFAFLADGVLETGPVRLAPPRGCGTLATAVFTNSGM